MKKVRGSLNRWDFLLLCYPNAQKGSFELCLLINCKAPATTINHFHQTLCWKNMFHCLATSLNIALKWFPICWFDLDQAFSPNILLSKQFQFGCLTTFAKESLYKKNLCDSHHNFNSRMHRHFAGSLCLNRSNIVCPFNNWYFVWMLNESVWSFY